MPIETLKDAEDKTLTDFGGATDDGTANPSESEAPEVVKPVTDGASLLKLILTQQIQYYIDRTGEPCLILLGDGSDQVCPIQSRRVKAFISSLAWHHGQMLLSAADLKRILRTLEGFAWEQAPRNASRDQIWNSLQEKPALQVVIEFMQDREKHEAQMKILHKELSELASKFEFDLRSKQWPKTASHLSAQLRQKHNRGILEQCGISVEFARNRNGSKVILKRVTPQIPGDDEEPAASPAASHGNPPPGNNLESSDAGDGKNKRAEIEMQILNRMNHFPSPKAKSEVNDNA